MLTFQNIYLNNYKLFIQNPASVVYERKLCRQFTPNKILTGSTQYLNSLLLKLDSIFCKVQYSIDIFILMLPQGNFGAL